MNLLSLILVCSLAATTTSYGRGQIPPPPPFSGGNVGGWLPRGALFGFDDGGGTDGGWAGGYYGTGGWEGWGYGSGGNGGYGGGPVGGGGGGVGDLLDTSGTKEPQQYSSCYRMTEIGDRNHCACWYTYHKHLPPCAGCPVHGKCGEDYESPGAHPDCYEVNQFCVTYAH